MLTAVKEIKGELKSVEMFSFGDAPTFGTHLNPEIRNSSSHTPITSDYTRFNGEHCLV